MKDAGNNNGIKTSSVKARSSGTTKVENSDNVMKAGVKTIKQFIASVFNDSEVLGPMCVLMFLCEAMFLEYIIVKIPYTEIDYSTYMQQITQIEGGVLDYNKISGDTGPIVYPGGYVFIYSWMKMLTKGMDDLMRGQEAFRLLYLVSLALTFLIYLQITGKNRIRPYFFYMLMFSKRLHSIYVLRLFNDCFVTFFMIATIFLLQVAAKFKRASFLEKDETLRSESRIYANLVTLLAIDTYCFGLSVKMNALLYLPGLLVVLYFLNDENLLKFIGMLLFGVLIEIGINFQFLSNGETIRRNFFKNAFDFNREFMYKWTVNWKFLDEDVFSSKGFHKLLLLAHVSTLLIFLFQRWITKSQTGKNLKQLIFIDGICKFYKNTLSENNIILSEDGIYYITNILMLSNLIGILFARSLHYQFLSWYYYSLPFLFSSTGLPWWILVSMLGVHEFCWNAYPTTSLSSICLQNILGFTIVMVYIKSKPNLPKKKLN